MTLPRRIGSNRAISLRISVFRWVTFSTVLMGASLVLCSNYYYTTSAKKRRHQAKSPSPNVYVVRPTTIVPPIFVAFRLPQDYA